MATKENHLHETEQHVLIMMTEVCKDCGGSITLTGSVFEYMFARCNACGVEFIAGHLAITQTVETVKK